MTDGAIQLWTPERLVEDGSINQDSRLRFSRVAPNRFGFVAAAEDVLYFFRFKSGANADPAYERRCKGSYSLVLKWRAQEFRDTHILGLSCCDGATEADASLAISTRNGQILVMNLYSQVYCTELGKMVKQIKQIKSVDEEGVVADEVRSIGLFEERSIDCVLAEKQKDKIATTQAKKELDELEQQDRINRISYSVVASGFHKGEISHMDTCVQRPVIATLSKMDATVRLWNYESGVCELVASYERYQRASAENDQIYLQSVALHPAGFQLAIALASRVDIFHVMHQSMHEFQTLEMRGCTLVKFSNGGQKLACVMPKEIRIYDTYRLSNHKTINIGFTNAVTAIAFSEDDTLLAAVSKEPHASFIKKYDVETGKQVGEGLTEKPTKFLQCRFVREERPNAAGEDLLPHERFENKLYVVCSKGGKMQCRCFDEKELEDEDQCLELPPQFDMGLFTDLQLVTAPTFRNMVLATDNGRLFTYPLPPNLQPGKEAAVDNYHFGPITCLMRVSAAHIATVGKDGTLFVYRVKAQGNRGFGSYTRGAEDMYAKFKRREQARKEREEKADDPEAPKPAVEESSDNDAFLSDEEIHAVKDDKRLGNVSLIDRAIVDEWRKQQEDLRQAMEKQKASLDEKLKNSNSDANKRIEQMNREKKRQLKMLEDEYKGLQRRDAEAKDDNTQAMKTMDLTHADYIEELHNLYEKKLQMEQQA
jgi:cilia- and flagella-associated protein 57